jgi:hypothetical protein
MADDSGHWGECVTCHIKGNVDPHELQTSFDHDSHWTECANPYCPYHVNDVEHTTGSDGYCTECGALVTVRGDFDGDKKCNSDDAVYLLRHTMLPDLFPVGQSGDFNNDNKSTSDDAVYLLRHTMLPDLFPIS